MGEYSGEILTDIFDRLLFLCRSLLDIFWKPRIYGGK